MIDISKNKYSKYLLFGSLYFSEGLMKAISVVILPIYLIDKNIPPELITLLLGVATSPMIIKFIWGGIVDHYIQRGRTRFIIFGGIISAISIFLLSFTDPTIALLPFGILLFSSWLGFAFLDVSVDALAIDISTKKERGKINGSMHAGQNIGVAAGSLAFPFIVKTQGYNSIFLISSIVFLGFLLLPILIKNTKKIKPAKKISKVLLNEFKKKNVIKISILTPIMMISTGLLVFVAPLYMKTDLKLDITQIGIISMLFTLSFAVGSLVGGYISDIISRKKFLGCLLITSAFFTVFFIFTDSWQNFSILYPIIGFLQGSTHAAYLAILMDNTNPRVGATQFSIYSGLSNLGNIGTSSISGLILVNLGFNRMFLLSAWFFGPALLILYFIKNQKK